MKKYNEDFDNKILELLADGNKQIQIAKKLGVSRAEISIRIKIMRERGVEVPSTQDVFDKKILELLDQGLTQEQIGKEIGRSDVFVSKRIKKMKEQGINIPKTKSEIINEKILDLLNDGLTQTQIAEILNVGQTAISGRIQRMRACGVKIILQHGTIYKKEETNDFNETDNQEETILENVQESDYEIIDTDENDGFEYSDSYTYQDKTIIYARPSLLSYFGKGKLSESDAKRIIDFVEKEICNVLGNKKIDSPYIIDLDELCKSLRKFLSTKRSYKGDFSEKNNLGCGIPKLLDYYYKYFSVGFSYEYLRRAITFDYRKKGQNEFEKVPLDQIDARVLRFWGCFYDDFPNEKTTIQDMITLVKKSKHCNLNHARLVDIERIAEVLRQYMTKRIRILEDSRFNHVGEQRDCFQRMAQILSDDEQEQSIAIQSLTQDAEKHVKEQKACLRRMAMGASIDLPEELKNILFECSQSRETLLVARALIDVLLDYEEL